MSGKGHRAQLCPVLGLLAALENSPSDGGDCPSSECKMEAPRRPSHKPDEFPNWVLHWVIILRQTHIFRSPFPPATGMMRGVMAARWQSGQKPVPERSQSELPRSHGTMPRAQQGPGCAGNLVGWGQCSQGLAQAQKDLTQRPCSR